MNNLIKVRPRGRPKGGLGKGQGLVTGRWTPKKWKVEHEIVVLMHVNGKTNKDIAKDSGRSELWVSLVINSPQAVKVIERIRSNLPNKEIGEKYKKILDGASKIVEDFMNNDELHRDSPIASVNVALKAMEMIDSRLKTVKETERITERTVVLMSEDNAGMMLDAIRKSRMVSELHRNKLELVKEGG